MSTPFGQLIADRAKGDAQKVVAESFARLNRWMHLSSSKMVSLDEVAWLATLVHLATKEMPEAPKPDSEIEIKGDGSKVFSKTAGSDTGVRSYVGGS